MHSYTRNPPSAELQRRIQATEMRCFRKDTTHLTQSKDHATIEEVRAKIPGGSRTTRRPPDRRKETPTAVILLTCLPFFMSGQNHLARAQRKGEKRQGRRKKRWEDNIREWTGLEFAKSQRAVGNREKWRKLVVKSSVVPQRPSRLRDR